MDMRKFTEKSTSALQNASALAREYGNAEIGQIHLLYALVYAEDGLIPALLNKMQKDVSALKTELKTRVEKLPKVQGGEQYVSRALAQAIEAGEAQMSKMGDSYLSVEHLFLGLLEAADNQTKAVFKAFQIEQNAFMQALALVRGNKRVDS